MKYKAGDIIELHLKSSKGVILECLTETYIVLWKFKLGDEIFRNTELYIDNYTDYVAKGSKLTKLLIDKKML